MKKLGILGGSFDPVHNGHIGLARDAKEQMNLDEVAMGVAVIEMAMPVAVNGVMLCMEYDGDVDMMAQSIFVTTIFSMVTIPVVAMFL